VITPPVEAERALLGGVLLDPHWLSQIDLEPQDFGRAIHGRLWALLREAAERGAPLDVVGACEAIHASPGQYGGLAYVSSLPESCPVTQDLDGYARIIRRFSVRLKALAALERTRAALEAAADDDALTGALAGGEQALLEASRRASVAQWHAASAVVEDWWELYEREEAALAAGEMLGLPCGLRGLQDLLGGLREPWLVIVGGVPTMGKTSLALQMADACLEQQIPVGVVSLEMTARQLAERRVAAASGVPAWRLRRRRITAEERRAVIEAVETHYHQPLHIDDESRTLAAVCASITRAVSRHGIKLAVVDYAQQIEAPGRDLNETTRAIAQTLQGLAKRLGIVILLLSQCTREAAGRRPEIKHLYGGTALEASADAVIFPWRPGEHDAEAAPDEAVVIVKKFRHGSQGEVKAVWRGDIMRFEDRTDLYHMRRQQ
jgi:replicative DNA helicase